MEEEQNIPNCQNGGNNTLPARTLKISPEQNIESISPPDQHNRDTDTVVPEGWQLGRNAKFHPNQIQFILIGDKKHIKER